MTEFERGHETDSEPPLDRELVVGRHQEHGVNIEPEDLKGEDDNDVLGLVTTYATIYDIDVDDILRQVTPIKKRIHEEDGEQSEI